MELSSGHRIIDGMATTLWGLTWASAAEEAGESQSGMKIEEVMPPVPMAAIVDAARLAGMIEQANGGGLYALLHRAAIADSGGDEAKAARLFGDSDYEARFGECLAYQGVGAGVSWFDDHESFPLEFPFFEPGATAEAAEDCFTPGAPVMR